MTALTDLLAALESDTDDKADYFDVWCEAIHPTELVDIAQAAADGDTQAAIDFIKAALPGWAVYGLYQRVKCKDTWQLLDGWDAEIVEIGTINDQIGRADTPARALLIAAVKALVEREAGNAVQ